MNKKVYKNLHDAVGRLLSVCDGSLKKDGGGFAKTDVGFARSLFDQLEWTPRQARATYKSLYKYREQLMGFGIEYADIKPDIEAEDEKDPVWTADLVEEDYILLSFNSSDKNLFYQTLDNIKDLPGRIYIAKDKKWKVPLSVFNINRIDKMGFKSDAGIKAWYEKSTNPENVKKKKESCNPEKIAKKINIPEMMPFQLEGVAFVEEKEHRALIGDDMGLGKTLQALAFLKLHPEMRPAVVVTTASMKMTWRREALKWIKEDCYIISGRNSASEYLDSNLGIFIINYDIVKDHLDTLSGMGIKNVTIDESHKISNPSTLRTVAVKGLCKDVPSVVGLTGTPFLNRPIEIFTIINILQPKIFPNYYRFGKKYCDAQHNGFGMEYKGVSNAEELHDLLKEHVMIRRMKVDVLKDLPEKTKSVIVFPITNRSVYEEAERDIIEFIHEQDGLEAAKRASRAKVLARFNKLKLLATEGKLQACVSWCRDFLESGEKLIVFAINKVVVDALMTEFGDIAVKIDGGVSQKNRQKAVDDFQTNDKIKLFVGNMPAASEGITLTAASNLAFLQLGWTPGIHNQSGDRILRIGQKNACTIYYLIAEKTIEEKISLMLDVKQKICDAVLDGKETEQTSLLSDMIEQYKTK